MSFSEYQVVSKKDVLSSLEVREEGALAFRPSSNQPHLADAQLNTGNLVLEQMRPRKKKLLDDELTLDQLIAQNSEIQLESKIEPAQIKSMKKNKHEKMQNNEMKAS